MSLNCNAPKHPHLNIFNILEFFNSPKHILTVCLAWAMFNSENFLYCFWNRKAFFTLWWNHDWKHYFWLLHFFASTFLKISLWIRYQLKLCLISPIFLLWGFQFFMPVSFVKIIFFYFGFNINLFLIFLIHVFLKF